MYTFEVRRMQEEDLHCKCRRKLRQSEWKRKTRLDHQFISNSSQFVLLSLLLYFCVCLTYTDTDTPTNFYAPLINGCRFELLCSTTLTFIQLIYIQTKQQKTKIMWFDRRSTKKFLVLCCRVHGMPFASNTFSFSCLPFIALL